MNIGALYKTGQKCSAKNEKHLVVAREITAKKKNLLRAVIQRSGCHEITQIGSCSNGTKGGKDIRIYFKTAFQNGLAVH